MGATIPAGIHPGSIDHVPIPTVVPVLGHFLWQPDANDDLKAFLRMHDISNPVFFLYYKWQWVLERETTRPK